MLEKSAYIISHYLFLLAFLISCWGIGAYVLQRAKATLEGNILLMQGIATTVGLGIYICILQGFAIIGALWLACISVPFFIGIILAIRHFTVISLPSLESIQCHWRASSKTHQIGLILVFLLVLSNILDPLSPPLEWDEVMYHLPHARQWAITGQLSVNTWLRYPWFPYNFDLLFAAALIAYDDVMPHLIHAMTGWLTALIVYQAGKRYFPKNVALLGCIIWLVVARKEFAYAYVDMGVTLFIFSTCIALLFWLEDPCNRKWLSVAAFLMGVAAGIKYQTLGFLPVFAIAVLSRERNFRKLSWPALLFLAPCIYWYSRNAILTGDPFNPVGAKIFGFHDWNLADYENQFQDLRTKAGWPHWLLWSGLFLPFLKIYRDTKFAKYGIYFCTYSFLVWLITSHYPRYLMPAYPVLSLLAASTWHWIWQKASSRLKIIISDRHNSLASAGCTNNYAYGRLHQIMWLSVICLALLGAMIKLSRDYQLVAPNTVLRDAILEKRISGYPVLSYLQKSSFLKTYQFGLEDAIYYSPNPIWGDHFGPSRYNDFAHLNPAELSAKLKSLGFDSVVVHTRRWPKIVVQPEFSTYFEEVYRKDAVILYRITKDK